MGVLESPGKVLDFFLSVKECEPWQLLVVFPACATDALTIATAYQMYLRYTVCDWYSVSFVFAPNTTPTLSLCNNVLTVWSR